ncbi:MAG: glycerophosphodiester phosphodiesterase [Alistipes sp.]|nr:glycerophosphodiester phosphodiesterase [Alistipes sp.]
MKKLLSLSIMTLVGFAVMAQPQVIAHRGFHATKGSARNSIASLKEAQKLGIFGSECDVNLTKDGEILVVHGSMHPDKQTNKEQDIKRVDIQKSSKDEVLAIKLENGETMPTFDQYLKQTKKDKKTKLIIEIKKHATPQRETEIVKAVVDKVAEYGLQEQVEYIAFRPFVCEELKRIAPEGTKIAYLNGDYTPEYVAGMGLSGIDYKLSVLKKNPKWIKRAHKLGMTVNVWTVNKEEDLRWVIENGVDYITTDNPVLAKKLIAEMCK